ncbi:ATP12 family chaperone protein [Falsigemmobacter intermedius]|uniref:ATP12 family chaperone protein n=1 Tax=Falsigemmobacter intermedius TaxID=1553448 RepID=UPI003F11332A
MSGWKAKRFWKEARVEAVEGGFQVMLDARAVKTPAKAPLILPTRAMAEAVAAEWDAQQGEIRPETMPVTRSANAAIDKVTHQFDAVLDMLAEYGGTDLLSYRADGPAELIARQAAHWDPLLDWAAERYDARLKVTSGVIPVAQDAAALARLKAALGAFDAFEMTALHDLIGISGSLILALAVAEGRITLPEAWAASRIDEAWQAEQWGADEEFEIKEGKRREALEHAARFLVMSRQNS